MKKLIVYFSLQGNTKAIAKSPDMGNYFNNRKGRAMRYVLFAALLFLTIGCQSVTKVRLAKVQMYPFAERLVIGVVDFENETGDEQYSELTGSISDSIIEELMHYERFRIVERDKLQKILQELDLEAAGLVKSENSEKVGRLLGVDALLLGTLKSVSHEEDKLHGGLAYTLTRISKVTLSARLTSVKNGEILAAAEVPVQVKQKRSVALGFAKAGTITSEADAVLQALEAGVKQMGNDLAVRVPPRSALSPAAE